eukprot:gene35739-43348_t
MSHQLGRDETVHQLSMLKHVKKKAANDAQLLMNRIALIQKEEERARKKIQQTKERAAEILALRTDNEERIKAYSVAASENKQLQKVLLARNREQEVEGKKARAQRFELLHNRRREEVHEMLTEKKYLTQLMIEEQQRDIVLKQARRERIKKMEEEARERKERERREREAKAREAYEARLRAEEAEARRAEQLVKALERKEREWIERLRAAQGVQESAFLQLERALTSPGHSQSRSPGRDAEAGGSGGMGRRSLSATSRSSDPRRQTAKERTGGHS